MAEEIIWIQRELLMPEENSNLTTWRGGGEGRENLWHQGMLLVTAVTLTYTQMELHHMLIEGKKYEM